MVRGVISLRIPLAYLGSFAVFVLLFSGHGFDLSRSSALVSPITPPVNPKNISKSEVSPTPSFNTAGIPLWMPVIGSAFAIIVVKELYGGLGQNFMNPALAR